jgi:hypothetical protein
MDEEVRKDLLCHDLEPVIQSRSSREVSVPDSRSGELIKMKSSHRGDRKCDPRTVYLGRLLPAPAGFLGLELGLSSL